MSAPTLKILKSRKDYFEEGRLWKNEAAVNSLWCISQRLFLRHFFVGAKGRQNLNVVEKKEETFRDSQIKNLKCLNAQIVNTSPNKEFMDINISDWNDITKFIRAESKKISNHGFTILAVCCFIIKFKDDKIQKDWEAEIKRLQGSFDLQQAFMEWYEQHKKFDEELTKYYSSEHPQDSQNVSFNKTSKNVDPSILSHVFDVFFKIKDEQFQETSLKISGLKTRPTKRIDKTDHNHSTHFYCLRYSDGIPGDIHVSLLRFIPPDEKYPYARYENFYRDKAMTTRHSNGVCFIAAEKIYMLGPIYGTLSDHNESEETRSAGLKVICLKSNHGNEPEWMEGLVMSNGENKNAIVSKICLLRVNKVDPDDALMGTFSPSHERYINEIINGNDKVNYSDIHSAMKNKIEFSLEDEIEIYDDKAGQYLDVEAKNLSSRIQDLINREGQEQKHRIRYKKSKEKFDPIDNKHYTFNRALF